MPLYCSPGWQSIVMIFVWHLPVLFLQVFYDSDQIGSVVGRTSSGTKGKSTSYETWLRLWGFSCWKMKDFLYGDNAPLLLVYRLLKKCVSSSYVDGWRNFKGESEHS